MNSELTKDDGSLGEVQFPRICRFSFPVGHTSRTSRLPVEPVPGDGRIRDSSTVTGCLENLSWFVRLGGVDERFVGLDPTKHLFYSRFEWNVKNRKEPQDI